jgi:hypothetical protein
LQKKRCTSSRMRPARHNLNRGMPRTKADHFINELLETSAVAFGLKDRRSPNLWFPVPGEQKQIAH